MSDKILELAKKLQALSERGEGGEKLNAQAKLDELLKKHNITIDELNGEKITQFEFTSPLKHQRLMHQVMVMIVGPKYQIFGFKNSKTEFVTNCTHSQFIEFDMTFSFYSKQYEKDLDLFYKAFVQRNRIFDRTPDSGRSWMDLTPDEIAEQRKVQQMSKGLDQHNLKRQITQK